MSDQPKIQMLHPYVGAAIASTILGCFYLGGIYLKSMLQPRAPTPVVAGDFAWVEKIPTDARPYVSAFYRDLCAVIESTEAVKTKDQFRTAHFIATQVLDKAKGDPDLSAVSADISGYFMEHLGEDPGPLSKDKLVPALKNLADAIHADPS